MAMGDHLRRHRWSGGPSMAAILGPGDPPRQHILPQMVRGELFWGDHLWHDRPFKKCPTAVLTATVAITNGHNVVVAVSFETAANPVHISSRILYVFLLCTVD